ncbi:alpha-galactosidase [Phlyctema vagabunda]|uniref:Alpha-galactosidase n=1 Tax=Phlyctema vagabunda TaxID=108571 RepID=A0ABR4P4L1_9HELO
MYMYLQFQGSPCYEATNGWNTFKTNFNQTTIETTAAKLISSGLADVGYRYVVMDEGWQAATRDAGGRQQANLTKFPSGVASLASSIHRLGLKIGIYSDAGIYDCGFFPGSYGNEELDAQTYATWGIDYLKYDNCGGFAAGVLSPQERFMVMGNALVNSGRDIFYSLCQWGQEFPWFWADQMSHSYRMSGDIHASFSTDSGSVCKTAYCLNTGYAGVSVMTMIKKMREISLFQAPGSWADMDMLEIGTGSLTEAEEQTHLSFWAALKSPLIIGADITTMNQSSFDILLNMDIIAINQDEAGIAASYIPVLSIEGRVEVWAGPLSQGSYVVLALNYGSNSTDITIPFGTALGARNESSQGYSVKDVWAARNLGVVTESITLKNVAVHQTKVLVFSQS